MAVGAAAAAATAAATEEGGADPFNKFGLKILECDYYTGLHIKSFYCKKSLP